MSTRTVVPMEAGLYMTNILFCGAFVELNSSCAHVIVQIDA